ncbi:uncharacterized protein LOC128964491 [Oppia nitens]|uniref:uncharacterized protein LOC128964491 n=1 Tax=Oppia nitens TaxID=1686743 RepID=UPI0023DBCB89|nr:uncharacterized protein LOC128964491 [Oppia nitens]
MFVNRLLSLNKRHNLMTICGNYLMRNNTDLLSSAVTKILCYRLVHSTNIHEIDYLFSKYKLSLKSSSGRQSYGQQSALQHFNTISDFNFETDKDVTIKTLRQVLEIRKSDSRFLVKNYPNLLDISEQQIEKQVFLLTDRFALNCDHFLSCPWVLYLPFQFITERLRPLGPITIDCNHLVLLLLPLISYDSVVKKIKKNNIKENTFEDFNQKLNLFTTNLNIINQEFCDLIHENTFLYYYDYHRLKTIMDLLKKANINTDIITSDIKVFTHNIDVMNKRIDKCIEYNMPVKTWMLRSSEESFQVCLQRHNDNKKVLKDYDNNIEYMTSHLNCNKNVIQLMTKRYPRIVKISAKKLSEKLSFLFKKGFTAYHIIDTPKILFHSVDTLVHRIKELEKINIHLNSLKILTLSEKEYQKLIQQFKSVKLNGYNSENDSKQNIST